MFAKEYDIGEQKMSMKVLWLGREKKGKKKKKHIAAFYKTQL